jgi:cation:H+ antiporter
MLFSIVLIVAGLVVLTVGAELLVRGGASLALRLGVTPLVIGLTVIAFGTGSPEFVVSLEAAIKGSSGIALGNVIGSNISNIALILGCSALIAPMAVKAEILRREMPILMAVTAFLCIMMWDGIISRVDGALLAIGSIAYTIGAYVVSKTKEDAEVEAEYEEAVKPSGRPAWLDAIFILLGLGALIFGANILVSGAIDVANFIGLSEAVIGLTIVAIGTSLPELATSVVASYRGEADISFGNVIGSNVFNILAVLGIAALISPMPTDGIRSLDIAVFLGSVIVIWAMLGRRYLIDRFEGVILLLGYVIYIVTLLAIEQT